MRRADQTTFIKALGLWDVVAMNIVAVVGLRWIARTARAGAPSVSLWLLACLLFFIPFALALIELSSRHPEQGVAGMGAAANGTRAAPATHEFVPPIAPTTRSKPVSASADVMTMARGMASVWLVAGCGFVATAIAIGLVFVPPPGTESVFTCQANLVGQTLGLFVIGGVFYLVARRRARA